MFRTNDTPPKHEILDIDSLPITIFLKTLAEKSRNTNTIISDTNLIQIIIQDSHALISEIKNENDATIQAIDKIDIDKKTTKQHQFRDKLERYNRNLVAVLSNFISVISSYEYACEKHSVSMFDYFNKINNLELEVNNLKHDVCSKEIKIEYLNEAINVLRAKLERCEADKHEYQKVIIRNKHPQHHGA